jgi:hypothetical protein
MDRHLSTSCMHAPSTMALYTEHTNLADWGEKGVCASQNNGCLHVKQGARCLSALPQWQHAAARKCTIRGAVHASARREMCERKATQFPSASLAAPCRWAPGRQTNAMNGCSCRGPTSSRSGSSPRFRVPTTPIQTVRCICLSALGCGSLVTCLPVARQRRTERLALGLLCCEMALIRQPSIWQCLFGCWFILPVRFNRWWIHCLHPFSASPTSWTHSIPASCCITESNRRHWVLLGMQNRTVGPYLAVNNRIPISVIAGRHAAHACPLKP